MALQENARRIILIFVSGVGLSPLYCGHFWPIVTKNTSYKRRLFFFKFIPVHHPSIILPFLAA
jgi:hypothetical protein